MRINSRHVAILALLIVLSIGFGLAFDAIATAVDRHQYPIVESLAEQVTRESEKHGIEEPILWAVLCTSGGFVSNAVSEDGRIGLMQLSPKVFSFVCTEVWKGEAMDAGMLYDPTTNLSAGCAYLAYLYTCYGVWEHVYAAYFAGIETVNTWLANPENLTAQGVLNRIPDAPTAAYVKEVTQAADHYRQLYYA